MKVRMKSWLLLPLFLGILTFPAHASRHALLIGVSDYGGSGFANLDGTLNDVELMRGVLTERFGFAAADIRTLTNGEATHDGIRRAFAELAQRVKADDQVYIHYSGHGSYTPDLNGDEKIAHNGSPQDSTWVSFGSRVKLDSATEGVRGGVGEVNNFDILDDELAEWMNPIYAKTANVAFVSDSCHSGTMTRGKAPQVRAIPVDLRPHPLGARKFAAAKQSGVRIGAARDDQQAGEHGADDGRSYGLFTWYWVQALNRSAPGESWEDAFKRTVALIGSERKTLQHPQFAGEGGRRIFGGDFPPQVPSLAISDVDGKTVILKAGSFQGVTVGSIYGKKGGGATLTVTEVRPFSSTAEVSVGTLEKGDLIVEEKHVYPYQPLKVFVRCDSPQDAALAATLDKTVAALPGYQSAASQSEADLLLLVIRPQRKDGKLVYAPPVTTLPQVDNQAKAEIWLLTADEKLTPEKLQLTPETPERAVQLVTENFKKMARINEIKALGASSGEAVPLVDLFVTRYSPVPQCDETSSVCLNIPGRGKFRGGETVPAVRMQDAGIKRGDLLAFKVRNNSADPLYCYLLDITSKGAISVIFPGPEDSAGMVLVPAGQERNFIDLSGILVEEVGEDYVKLIVSALPLDVTLFEQTAYQTRGTKGGSDNPLQDFLGRAMGGTTRGRLETGRRSQWGTVQFSFLGE